MRNSIVSIESVSNNSFGTGFVIDSDEKGVYILTCQHVLDDVKTPVVENVLAKVIAKGGFIDMAVLYVSKLHLEALPLQTKECDQLDVEVIGFSHFNQNLTQKKHIKATLYQELIELHSKEEDAYYNVRKIKANDGFNFDRGNSGSPVICKSSGNVIAMISNKEGNDIGYAIDIVNLKEVWKDAPSRLFEKPRAVIEQVSGTKDKTSQEKKRVATNTVQKSSSSSVKYLIVLAIILGIGFGVYTVFGQKSPTQEHPKHLRFNVVLTNAGQNKIYVIKAIRNITGFGLKQSKEMIDHLPSTIQRNLSKEQAEKLKKELQLNGASCRLERVYL